MSDYASSVGKAKNRTLAEDDRTMSLVHELQAPLTVLRVRLEKALRASWCGPECRAALEPCLDDLRGASQMVSDLLLLEEAGASEPTPHREAIDLAELASETSRDYLALAESKGIRLTLDELPAIRVTGNARELRRILVNLLDNAVRHTASGGAIRVRIALAGGHAELRVIDNGPGISPEHQPRIFERFYQIDRNADRAAGGVGLGLAIARSLAERNGAHVDLESAPGKGSTFILRLPIATAND